MNKHLERLTFFVFGAVVCSLGFLIGTSHHPSETDPDTPEHATFKSITLTDDEITYTLTPRSIKITAENGYIEVGHGSYSLHPSKKTAAIYEQMGTSDVDNAGFNVKYEAGDVKIIRYKGRKDDSCQCFLNSLSYSAMQSNS